MVQQTYVLAHGQAIVWKSARFCCKLSVQTSMIGNETKLLMSQTAMLSSRWPCFLVCCAVVVLCVHCNNIHIIVFIV